MLWEQGRGGDPEQAAVWSLTGSDRPCERMTEVQFKFCPAKSSPEVSLQAPGLPERRNTPPPASSWQEQTSPLLALGGALQSPLPGRHPTMTSVPLFSPRLRMGWGEVEVSTLWLWQKEISLQDWRSHAEGDGSWCSWAADKALLHAAGCSARPSWPSSILCSGGGDHILQMASLQAFGVWMTFFFLHIASGEDVVAANQIRLWGYAD